MLLAKPKASPKVLAKRKKIQDTKRNAMNIKKKKRVNEKTLKITLTLEVHRVAVIGYGMIPITLEKCLNSELPNIQRKCEENV